MVKPFSISTPNLMQNNTTPNNQVSSFDSNGNKNKLLPTQKVQLTLANLLSPTTPAVEITDMMTLLKVLGHAFLQLCLYKCQESIKVFGKLSKK